MKFLSWIISIVILLSGTQTVDAQSKRKLSSLLGVKMPAVSSPVQNANSLPEDENAFEGEIVYETYENYSDYIKKMANSIYFDGVHKIRVILKGSKMHLIDETTKCHLLVDAAIADPVSKGGATKEMKKQGGACVHFCDFTKTGMDFTSQVGGTQAAVLVPWDLVYADGTKAPVSAYSFAATSTVKTIMDKNCTLYEGDVNHTMGSMDQKYHVQAYVSDIPAPKGYPWSVYGLQLPNIATKWIVKYDGGHVSVMSVGELSYYIEADVTEIKAREVSDEEFTIHADYKISKGASNPFALLKYYKGIKKELEKNGIKGGDKSEKSSGVHYKTDGTWDF